MSKKVDWKTFNYWDPEHYVVFKVTGSKEVCQAAFESEREKYPTGQYGTIVSDRNFEGSIEDCFVEIKRFKTKELLRIHHDYPITYVREGKVL